MARVKDRIAPNSVEHWALFLLDTYERNYDPGVGAEELYRKAGSKLPSADYLQEALDEVCSRGLAELNESAGAYRMRPPGNTAIKHHGHPKRAPWETQTPDPEPPDAPKKDILNRSAWEPTPTDRVFYASEADQWNRGELKRAANIIEDHPEWHIVITMGPYRFLYDFAYGVYDSRKLIHLDFHSPALQAPVDEDLPIYWKILRQNLDADIKRAE